MDDLCSLLSEDIYVPQTAPQQPAPVPQPVPAHHLLSAERVMTCYPGRDLKTLQKLAVSLSKGLHSWE